MPGARCPSLASIPVISHLLYMIWACLGAFGACLGSFLNVVIYRLPLDKSIVYPGSSCPSCGKPISWYDNIPIFSYIILLGKCRNCGTGISIRYPLVEAAAMGLTLLVYWRFGLDGQYGQAAIALILSLGMLAVALIDLDHMIIPDELSIGGIVVGLGLSFVPGGVDPIPAVIGAVAGSGSLWLLRWGHMKLSGVEGMGLGDVKLAGTIGAFLGWYALPMVLFMSAITGLIAGGGVILFTKKGGRTPIPFGTFLALGTVVYVMAEPWLWVLIKTASFR